MAALDIPTAITAYVESRVYLRVADGATLQRDGALWQVHLGRMVDGHTDEFYVMEANPSELVWVLQEQYAGVHYWLNVFPSEPDKSKTAFEALDFTLRDARSLMARSLVTPAVPPIDYVVKRVRTAEDARWVNATLGMPVVNLRTFNDITARYYYITHDGQLAASGCFSVWQRTVAVIDAIHVRPGVPQQAIVTALVQQMLVDADQMRAMDCVVAARIADQQLYYALGFVDLQPMLTFS